MDELPSPYVDAPVGKAGLVGVLEEDQVTRLQLVLIDFGAGVELPAEIVVRDGHPGFPANVSNEAAAVEADFG